MQGQALSPELLSIVPHSFPRNELYSSSNKSQIRNSSPSPPSSGGILATFDVSGEQFNVWITNPGTIEQILALQAGQSTVLSLGSHARKFSGAQRINMQSGSQSYDLGYHFYPPDHPHDPGHPRLDIVLQSSPSLQHFDPDRVEIPVVTPGKNSERLTIYHPWPGLRSFQVYPGRIILRDRLNKVIEAFSFGGALEITTGEPRTVIRVQSEAPILNLAPQASIAILLAEEVEILLAERRAVWSRDLNAFEARLASIAPFVLYTACLNTLRRRFQQLHPISEGSAQKFYHFLVTESRELQAIHPLPAHTQTLSELL